MYTCIHMHRHTHTYTSIHPSIHACMHACRHAGKITLRYTTYHYTACMHMLKKTGHADAPTPSLNTTHASRENDCSAKLQYGLDGFCRFPGLRG